MYKIGIVTGTRAEYSLLKPLIQKVSDDNELEPCLIVTGTHLEKKFGNTVQEIVKDGYIIHFKVPMNLESDDPRGICISMSQELKGLSIIFEKTKLDMVFLLGDRYEMLIVAIAAMMFQIPIAHLHGGEITEGAMDDAIRHCISKMSSIHFPSTKISAKRLKQLGEPPNRIFPVGALGVENIKRINYLDKSELCKTYSPLFGNPYIMVTYHPVTLEKNTAESQFQQLLSAISEKKEYSYIFTYANADTEGNIINILIEDYVGKHENACAFCSMGQRGYLSALNYAVCVLGNSSSGIIEAPSFHIPTVNIGNRQKGREYSESVVSCGNTKKEICAALEYALSEAFLEKCRKCHNPYEKNDTSKKIISITKKILKSDFDIKKKFLDVI